MAFAYCPECGERIYLGRKPWTGQPAFCDGCDADLEVTRLNPLELDWTDSVEDTPWADADEPWERDRALTHA